MLKIFNTLTKKKEKFTPFFSNIVNIYVCGITIYDLCHIGHARTFIIFDIIVRYLYFSGYKVNYVRNITDIDDKIIRRVINNNENYQQFIHFMIDNMHKDFDSLNILRPNYEPRVTNYIHEIINFIDVLLKKKYAYISSHGDILFNINNYSNYGILSSAKQINNLGNINYRNRIFINKKLNPIDFVLWKMSKFGEPKWSSPWGNGRPGWHIECSAIHYTFLGTKIDIHGGGSDLIFPHHENELAQSVCAYNDFNVNIWIHTGMLILNNQKMSKSLNNFFTIRDILKFYDSETIRFFLLSVHYRKPIKYTKNSLKNSRLLLEKLYIALRNTDKTIAPMGGEYFISQFIAKMNDDFNVPEAYSILFNLAHHINNLKIKHSYMVNGMASTLRYLGNILGLLYNDADTFLHKRSLEIDFPIEKILELIQCRNDARKQNKWDVADEIRNTLFKMNIIVEDGPNGTTWRYRC